MQKERGAQYIFALFGVLICQLFSLVAVTHLNYSINGGLVFGYWQSNAIAALISVLALMIFLRYASRGAKGSFILLIVSGALSNIIDRTIWGGVVDYIKFWFIPLFNLADVFIVLGLTVYFFNLFSKQKSPR